MPKQPSAPTLWVLDDGRPGNTTQCLGIAQALGYEFTVKPVHFNFRGYLPNLLKGPNFASLNDESWKQIQPPWPDLAIGAGRRVAPILRAIKKESKGKTRIIQLLNPEVAHRDFDILILPEHDRPKPRPNLLTAALTPHRLTAAQLDEARRSDWPERWESLPFPRIAVILGGNTKAGDFGTTAATHLADQLHQAVATLGGAGLLLSTSRRTSPRALEAFRRHLKVPAYLYDWHNEQGRDNPLLPMLVHADAVVMTGDSMAMLSEAAFTGKPLYIADKGPHIAPKHRRFHEHLYRQGIARPFTGEITPFTYPPANAAESLAAEIRQRLKLP